MVGLASLFLTIIYIGAIFLRKKFISVLTSAVGTGDEQGHQSALLAYLTRRLAWQVLFDIGLDALPIIGPLLGRRRRRHASGEGGGFSAMDEVKLWWKSRRSDRGEPVYDQSVESHPPIEGPGAEKPNAGNLPPPSPPEAPEIRARFDRGAGREDQPVFVYTDRGRFAPEEGTLPEPARFHGSFSPKGEMSSEPSGSVSRSFTSEEGAPPEPAHFGRGNLASKPSSIPPPKFSDFYRKGFGGGATGTPLSSPRNVHFVEKISNRSEREASGSGAVKREGTERKTPRADQQESSRLSYEESVTAGKAGSHLSPRLRRSRSFPASPDFEEGVSITDRTAVEGNIPVTERDAE